MVPIRDVSSESKKSVPTLRSPDLSQSSREALRSFTMAIQRNLFDADPTPWEDAADDDCIIAEVVFNRPLPSPYSYLVPDDLRSFVQPGQRVKAPLGRGSRLAVGYCVSVGSPGKPLNRRLKSIDSVLDREPLVSSMMLELTRWISESYLCGWGQVLESVIPAGVKKKAGTRVILRFELDPSVRLDEFKLPRKQQAVVNALAEQNRPMAVDELCDAADCGTGPVQALRTKGIIRGLRKRSLEYEVVAETVEKQQDLKLNTDQSRALKAILSVLRAQQHRTILLHGVTGSGKTEVYIQSIREVVSYGRQAIVLVPEISLTPQTIRRFRTRFDSVAVLHSHLSDSERHWHWQQIASGAVQVVVGARSAVFAPVPHPGLIVIDEEHETSFKQDSVPRYHAREVARKRAQLEKIPLILGSATPTLESWLRVHRAEDSLICMPRRVAGLPLPHVSIVDVRTDPRINQGLSIGRVLRSGIQTALRDNGQVILFLNLRGFSPTVWCRTCGDGVKCPECDITLTWHRDRGIILCHYCDYESPPPRQCPHCGEPGVRYLGTGTQKLEQEVKTLFREYKVMRMDSDSMRKPGSHDEALEAFRSGEIDILLGTQMIAKGLDFPNVTLVGVIDADTMLHQPDVRSTERTFQLIAQVSGRTGRSERGGRVLVQTSNPTEPAIIHASNHDYESFAKLELRNRRELEYVPFRRLARVILRGEIELDVRAAAETFAERLREEAKNAELPIETVGPAPAPIAKLRRHFRYHLYLWAPESEQIRTLWNLFTSRRQQLSGVEFAIDVDPLNLR